MKKQRGSDFIAVIGTNNTGKSVIVKELIKKFNLKRDRLEAVDRYPANYNKLIVYDPQDRFKDLLRKGDHVIKLNHDNWAEDVLRYKASLLVMDDYKELFENDRLPKQVMNLMSARAEAGIDIILVTWHPKLILPRLSMFINKFVLLKSNGKDKDYISRIDGEEDFVLSLRDSLNKEYQKYTPEQYAALYPNFPFIYYDSSTNKAKKINFK